MFTRSKALRRQEARSATGAQAAGPGARAAPARGSGVASSGATCARAPVHGSPGLTQSTGPTRSGTRGARAPSSSTAAMAAGHSGQPDLPVRDRDGRPAAGTFRRWPARPEGGGGLGLQASRGWADAVSGLVRAAPTAPQDARRPPCPQGCGEAGRPCGQPARLERPLRAEGGSARVIHRAGTRGPRAQWDAADQAAEGRDRPVSQPQVTLSALHRARAV